MIKRKTASKKSPQKKISKKAETLSNTNFNPNPNYGDSALGTQVGGNHYKKMGHYQPWEVLKQWLTEEEFRGYMKGTAIAYLAREQEKGKDIDVGKAAHTLEAFLEMITK